MPCRSKGSNGDLTDLMEALLKRVDRLIKREKLPWIRHGSTITVDLSQSGRSQQVRLERRDDLYVFRSVVVGSDFVTRTDTSWRELAHRVWRKNALKEFVTFAFDEMDRLIGFIEQPVVTLDQEELKLYIEVLARECDRLEYSVPESHPW